MQFRNYSAHQDIFLTPVIKRIWCGHRDEIMALHNCIEFCFKLLASTLVTALLDSYKIAQKILQDPPLSSCAAQIPDIKEILKLFRWRKKDVAYYVYLANRNSFFYRHEPFANIIESVNNDTKRKVLLKFDRKSIYKLNINIHESSAFTCHLDLSYWYPFLCRPIFFFCPELVRLFSHRISILLKNSFVERVAGAEKRSLATVDFQPRCQGFKKILNPSLNRPKTVH